MTRVPVPEDYEARDVPLPEDGLSGDADLRGYTGRVAQVREDEDGRYVGVPEYLAEDVREFLGVDAPDDGADGDDPETCQEVKTDGEVCGRDLPCPYHSDDADEADADA